MSKFSQLLLLICLLPLKVFSQELEVSTNNQSSDYYYDQGFNNRYRVPYPSSYNLSSTSFYKQKKVKKMEVYDSYNQLCWMMELDTAGKIIKSGLRGYYFIVTETYDNAYNNNVTVVQYFDHQKLVRLDTIISSYYNYQSADTNMHFARSVYKIYKRGELINEQNTYYNDKYLGKALVIDHSSPFGPISISGEDPDKPKVYLKKKLKNDYDTAKLYCCQKQIIDHDLYASSDSGHADIPLEKITNHPFFKKYRSSNVQHYLVDGESFDEPSEYHEAMRCGSYYYYQQHRNDGVAYGYTRNEKGLQDSFYSDYYPVDTSKVAEAVPETSSGTKLQPVIVSGYGDPYQRRLPTPVRTAICTFKYEYFEE